MGLDTDNLTPTKLSKHQMKLLKTLTLGAVAAASIGTASAQTTLHICGSTAFRNGASAAIIDYLSNNLAPGSSHVYGGTTVATTSEGILSAGAALYANGTIGAGGTATLIVETYWTGSLAGVVDVTAGNTTGLYIDPNNLTSTQLGQFNNPTANSGTFATTSPYGGGVELTGTVTTQAFKPDMAFSDSYQGTISKELATGQFVNSSVSVGSYSSISALATACAGTSIKQAGTSSGAGGAGFEGIVPFEWVLGNVQNAAVTSAISNISQQAARGLISDGYVPQSYLTGTNNGTTDTANYFYLVGRNEDSGTRIGALSESQFGVTSSPVQFEVTAASTTSPVTALQEYPVTDLNTELNIVWNTLGHSGYSSGSNVAGALESPENATALSAFSGESNENTGASYLIGYVGATDAASALAAGGHALTYNGVPFSVAAVENGQYTFWTYEHCYRLSAAGTAVAGLADGIADDVYNNDADVASNGTHSTTSGAVAGGILDNASSPVLVQRSLIEGGIISNY